MGFILGECCINGGKDIVKVKEVVCFVFDIMIKEKGVCVIFLKLLLEEILDVRV